MERVLWVIVDILIRQIVGAAFTKAALTVGGNVPLTSGKETGIISAFWNVCEVKNVIAEPKELIRLA